MDRLPDAFCTLNVHLLDYIADFLYNYLYSGRAFFTFLATKGKHTHRGALLEAAVQASGINISQMVKRMGIARSTYYHHCAQRDLSLEKLAQYGSVLKHDFSDDLPEMKKWGVEESQAPYEMPKSIEEAISQRDHWRDKYYALLEKFVKEAAVK